MPQSPTRKGRPIRPPTHLPLTEALILRWADAHFKRTKTWPRQTSGEIQKAPGTTWYGVNLALIGGSRGLRGGSSLARLLARHRQVRNKAAPPRLKLQEILAWADAHCQRVEKWPTRSTGTIPESPGETWWSVDLALRRGTRGLPGDSSLSKVLLTHRGVRSNHATPELSIEQILKWAKAHRQRTGNWPTSLSGSIPKRGGENWKGIDYALREGRRGLPGGSSVAKLLAEQGWKTNLHSQRELTLDRILKWVDIHREETGSWPHSHSGKVHHLRGETWDRVDSALRKGLRGLAGGSSLAQLLATRRGVRNPADPPTLTVAEILAWADAHHARTGQWPRIRTGSILEAPGETWKKIHTALSEGCRGLPGGSSLARLLASTRGALNPKDLPRMTIGQILSWADCHHSRTGSWPTIRSGPIQEAPGETWQNVDSALRRGSRGLPGGSSLFCLLQAHRTGPLR